MERAGLVSLASVGSQLTQLWVVSRAAVGSTLPGARDAAQPKVYFQV